MIDRGRAAARSNLLMSPVVAVAGLAATFVVVRTLAPSAFAVYAVIIAFKGTIQFASDFGTGTAATRLFGELQVRGAATQARRLYARLMTIRGLIAIAVVAGIIALPGTFAHLLGLTKGEREILPLLAVIAAAEAVSSLGYSVLAGLLRHGWINRVVLASTIAQPVVVIVAAAAGWGLVGITAGLLVGSVLRSGGFHLASTVALRRLEDRQGVREGVVRSYVRTATGAVLGKLAAWVHSRQLVTLIAIQAAPRASVAVFALAYDLVQQVAAALSSPVNSLLLPLQAASAGDEDRARRMYASGVRLLALVVVPVLVFLLALFPAVVDAFFSGSYSRAPVFAAVFVPVAVGETALSGPATALMLSNDALIGAFARVKAVAAVLGVVYFVLSGADLLVVAVAMLVIRTATTIALVLLVRRRLGAHAAGPWVPRLALVAGLTGAGALLPWLLLGAPLAALAVGAVAGALVLLVSVRRVRLVGEDDSALARELLPALAPLIALVSPPGRVSGLR